MTYNRKHSIKTHLTVLFLSALALLTSATTYAQITPSADSYTNTADPTTNYGAKTLLDVDGASQVTFIQFNLASIPTGATVSQATLKLYVNTVTTAGSFNVDYVSGTWLESSIDSSNAPALGAAIASNVALTTADKNQYILINVTSAVQAWLSGSETNNGIALVANSTFNATFDSKESTTTSHPPELDIVFAPGSGGGTITGVTAGTGLSGGGTSGTVTLNNSGVLSVTAGTGISSSGGQTPTIAINTSVVPQLGTANTFTGNQNVTGSVTATEEVQGQEVSATTFYIGGYPFGSGSYSNQNAFLGFASSTKNTGTQNLGVGVDALYANTTGKSNVAAGFAALSSNTTGNNSTAVGVGALLFSTTGASNTATGQGALIYSTTGSSNTATGVSALSSNTTGSNNTGVGLAAGSALDNSKMTGSGNTFLGSQAFASTGSLTNATAIGANALVSESNALVLGSGVDVGIGTSRPSHLLEVDASATNAQIAMVSAGTDAAISVNNKASGGREYWIDSGSGSAGVGAGNLAIWDNTAGAVRLVVNSTGQVGISTKTPGGQLEVDSQSASDTGIIAAGASATNGSGQGGSDGIQSNGGTADTDSGTNDGANNGAGIAASGGSGAFVGGIGVAGHGGTGSSLDGVGGWFSGGNSSTAGHGVLAFSGSGYAGEFFGDVNVVGALSKSSGSFKIDHPLDPANKYLYHSFVESPDMKNIYDGVATLDSNGEAVIQMPDWFGVLNRDFRYQLTCIGGFAPIYIAEEMANNEFKIGGGRAGMKVSWQITGIRQDAWANAHRIPVEEEKNEREAGFYIHPELYGAPPEKQVEWARHPQMMKKMQEHRQQTKEKQARLTAATN